MIDLRAALGAVRAWRILSRYDPSRRSSRSRFISGATSSPVRTILVASVLCDPSVERMSNLTKVATCSRQSSHPFGAVGFGSNQCVVLPLGFLRFVRGGCDGTGKAADEKGEEDPCVSFRRGRSARAIATHCDLARRSVALTLERFAASGLSWPEACDLDDEVLEAALYRRSRASDWPEVDWAAVEKALSGRGMTLMLLWEEWRETHPDGMSYGRSAVRPGGERQGHRFLSGLDARDDERRPLVGPVGVEHVVPSDRHSLRSFRPPLPGRCRPCRRSDRPGPRSRADPGPRTPCRVRPSMPPRCVWRGTSVALPSPLPFTPPRHDPA